MLLFCAQLRDVSHLSSHYCQQISIIGPQPAPATSALLVCTEQLGSVPELFGAGVQGCFLSAKIAGGDESTQRCAQGWGTCVCVYNAKEEEAERHERAVEATAQGD